jgi:hypothetical protein
MNYPLDVSENVVDSFENGNAEGHVTTNGELQEVADGMEQGGESMCPHLDSIEPSASKKKSLH